MDDDEASLVAAVGGGSERAFNLLIDRHQQAVRAFLRNLVPDAADADDIAQETFLAAWTQARGFAGRSSVRSWLCAIAWRKTRGAYRAAYRRRAREAAWQDLVPAQTGGQSASADRLALAQALAALPMDQRAAVALCLAAGLTHDEAAEALGLPLGTVKSHVTRGRARLAAALGDGR